MKKLLVVLLSLGLILAFIMTASAADVSYYFGNVAAFDSGANKTDYVALGAGYLWTGDHLKGINSTGAVGNDYLLMNRLSLSF